LKSRLRPAGRIAHYSYVLFRFLFLDKVAYRNYPQSTQIHLLNCFSFGEVIREVEDPARLVSDRDYLEGLWEREKAV